MQWPDVLNDPCLRDLPYKIELNEWGQIVMSPASNRHGFLQTELVFLLKTQCPQGRVITECSIHTPQGVKVADLAWCSDAFIQRHDFATPYPEAPEICVEIVSPGNSAAEMEVKRALYRQQGAHEVWIVSEEGEVTVYDAQGAVAQSAYVTQWSEPFRRS